MSGVSRSFKKFARNRSVVLLSGYGSYDHGSHANNSQAGCPVKVAHVLGFSEVLGPVCLPYEKSCGYYKKIACDKQMKPNLFENIHRITSISKYIIL